MASRREPMWYCHECHAEMRPLMVPDPHCASCNGTFVEKIEGETDDPREFQASGPAIDVDDAGADLGFESFLTNLTRLMGQGAREQPAANTGASSVPPNRERSNAGVRLEFSRGSSGGTRTWVLGGSPTLGGTRRPSGASGPSGGDSPAIAGPLMAQYLLSMLSQRSQRDGREDPFGGFNMFGRTGGPEDGRWGDYVFNQEALDQIITQMMENSNSHGPVPATDEVMQKLDRQVLEENSPTLERDCAVCKEQFSLHTEDPDEQVVVTLPCKHPFHEGCIIPWLKSSGTCPVCRYASF
ncbi:hypothetical protein FA95DRAFT_1542337 [Auriscalpium vulgare]|uniref:Uncharacterized protein n=1 Tax=Auriscalpium vulgare TaxID=40419 RepID=A0ACB8RQT5_9AGAM|nr:hypothetical protein FA95DRAFT_1542337 [Auriscalpium vulgare]